MPNARLASASDLSSLLDLFAVSEVSAAAQPRERAESIWRDTLAQQGTDVFVSDDGDRIAATCTLITAPNLLREGRRHGILENVVSHPELRARHWGSSRGFALHTSPAGRRRITDDAAIRAPVRSGRIAVAHQRLFAAKLADIECFARDPGSPRPRPRHHHPPAVHGRRVL